MSEREKVVSRAREGCGNARGMLRELESAATRVAMAEGAAMGGHRAVRGESRDGRAQSREGKEP